MWNPEIYVWNPGAWCSRLLTCWWRCGHITGRFTKSAASHTRRLPKIVTFIPSGCHISFSFPLGLWYLQRSIPLPFCPCEATITLVGWQCCPLQFQYTWMYHMTWVIFSFCVGLNEWIICFMFNLMLLGSNWSMDCIGHLRLQICLWHL